MAGERRLRILRLLVGINSAELDARRLSAVSAEVTGMTGAGVMLLVDGLARGSLCSSDEVSAQIEELQFTLGEGPCIDACHLDTAIFEPDLAHPDEGRWPAFSGPALEAGARAVFGFPLRVGAVHLGALNLYRDQPGALTDEQLLDVAVMADVVADAILLMQSEAPPGHLAAELEAGADLKYVVHQASGMVAAQLGIGVGESLIRLRAHAFGNNLPLTKVAEDVVARRLRLRRAMRGGPVQREESLITTFAELADTLVDDFDVVELLTLLAHRCVEVLDVDAAGLMLASPDGELKVLASSSDAIRVLELFELQAEEGPCPECYRTGEPVVNPRLDENDRWWPRFAPQAIEAGFRSALAVPMRLRGQTIGALNLFRNDHGSLNDADLRVAQAFADVATIAILQHRAAAEAQVVNAQLTLALNTRVVIEQAKGMVSERLGLNMETSFERLRSHPRNHSARLVDVGRAVIDGSLPAETLDKPGR